MSESAIYPLPDPYYVVNGSTVDEFVRGMLALGQVLETSVIGVFDDHKRGSRRDIELPLHKDGQYSKKLAEAQGGEVVTFDFIDIVGIHCFRAGKSRCVTTIGLARRLEGGAFGDEVEGELVELELGQGDSLIFDNYRCLHGRRGAVGEREALRMWLRNDRLRGRLPTPPRE